MRKSISKSSPINEKDIKENEKFEKYINLKIIDLRSIKNQMIDEDNFDESEYIENIIQFKSNSFISIFTEDMKKEIENKILEIFSNILIIFNNFKKDEKKIILNIRKEKDDQFNKYSENHLKQIEELISKRESEISLISQKKTSDYNLLIEQSRKLAKINNFESARKLKKKAEKNLLIFIENQIKKINLNFEKKIEKLLKKQENELILLNEKLINSLNENKKKFIKNKNESIKTAQSSFKSILRDYTSKISREICSYSIKTTSINECEVFINKIIKENEIKNDFKIIN